jgi:magnesium-transporting ATPase (P-type)
LEAVARHSPWHTLASQFKNVLVVILLVATALSALLGHGLETAVIAAIVSFAVLLGFIQEYRAERTLEALREMAAPIGHAIRDGVEIAIPARELVPSDVIVLRAGDRVPADARIALAVNLSRSTKRLSPESCRRRKAPRVVWTRRCWPSAIVATWHTRARWSPAGEGKRSSLPRGWGLSSDRSSPRAPASFSPTRTDFHRVTPVEAPTCLTLPVLTSSDFIVSGQAASTLDPNSARR